MYLIFAIVAGVHRRLLLDHDARRADVSRHADLRRSARLQRLRHRPRPDHGVLHDHAGDDRRLRQLVRAADDRRARHGVPAHEQHLVLAAAVLLRAAGPVDVRGRRFRRHRRRRRLDDLCAALDLWLARAGDGSGDLLAAYRGRVLDPGRDQLHHHDLQHARAGHDAAQDAAVRLVDPGDDVPAAAVAAGSGGRHHHAADRPPFRHDLLQSGRRRRSRSCTSICSGSSATRKCTS